MSRTILLADDSLTIQKVIALTFLDDDYEVVTANNGDAAMSKLVEIEPDLVITDVHMPGPNGYEVCRRSKELRPGVPVLLLIGAFEAFDEAESNAAGADRFLKKPFESQELQRLVDELLTLAASQETENVAVAAPAAELAAPVENIEVPGEVAVADASDLSDTSAIPEAPAELVHEGDESEFAQGALATPIPIPEPTPIPTSEPVAANLPFSLADDDETDDFGSTADLIPTFDGDETAETEISLEEAAAPAAPVEETPPRVVEDPVEVTEPVEASEVVEAPVSAAAESTPEPILTNGSGSLSDEDVDRIAHRLAELLSPQILESVAWDVIPDMAELVVRERLRQLESQVE